MNTESPDTTRGSAGGAPADASGASGALDSMRREVESSLQEGYAGVAADFDQLQHLFEDVVCDLNRALRVLHSAADGPSPAPGAAAVPHLVKMMQFEDIASQILQRTRRRLALLEAFTVDMLFGRTAHTICQPGAEGQDDVWREYLEQVERHRARLREVLERSVRQQSMKTGEIELF